MPVTPGRTRIRLLWAALCTAALALTVVVPAQAADPVTFSGRVIFPAGYVYSTSQRPLVQAWEDDSWPSPVGRSVTVAEDGTFTLTDTTFSPTQPYLIDLRDPRGLLVQGLLSSAGTVVPLARDARELRGGATGLQIAATPAVEVTGRVQMPAGYVADASEPVVVEARIGHLIGFTQWRELRSPVATDGTYRIGGIAAGTEFAIVVNDPTDQLFDGYELTDGTLSGAHNVGGNDAVVRKAPQSGLRVSLNLAGDVTGTVVVPDGHQMPYYVTASSEFGTRYTRQSSIEDDGSFVLDGLDRTLRYVIHVGDSWGELESGFRTADGGVTPSRDAAALVSVPSSGHVVRLRPKLGLRGTVTVPPGLTADDLGDSPSAHVVLWARESATGPWVEQESWVGVDDDLTFSELGYSGLEDREYLLFFESNAAAHPQRARLDRGFWTGNTTALSTDVADARPVRPSRVRDLVIPLSTRVVTRPSVSGTAALGAKLWAKRGTWDPATVTTSVQWLRDGAAISGATASSYVVTKSDIGRQISVRVTAKGPSGYAKATSTSARTAVVPKVKPDVNVWAPSGIKAGQKVQVVVKVTASSVTSAALGTVKVRVGSATRTVTLKASDQGRVSVTMPAQTKGAYEVRAAYTPSSAAAQYLTSRTSPTISVKIS